MANVSENSSAVAPESRPPSIASRSLLLGIGAVRAGLRARVRSFLPDETVHVLRHARFCVRVPATVLRTLGLTGAARFVVLPVWYEIVRLASSNHVSGRLYSLTVKGMRAPLRCRVGSSDVDVFRQIFVEREYDCLDDLEDPQVLVDCGANVGFSSAWFLSRYPTLSAIAVEADIENATLARLNLSAYGDRVELLEAGVWSHPTGLTVVRGEFGDGREWATYVRESKTGEAPDIDAVDIPTLIAARGGGRVDVLKIDIEGTERELFKTAAPGWLERINNLVIEIHGPELEDLVDGAIPRNEFARSFSGELSCYRRIGPAAERGAGTPAAALG